MAYLIFEKLEKEKQLGNHVIQVNKLLKTLKLPRDMNLKIFFLIEYNLSKKLYKYIYIDVLFNKLL